jgi:hypothetical protein
MTRDTVMGDTPARRATSLMVGADPERREERVGAAGVKSMGGRHIPFEELQA